jgi:hypothetical protein
MRVNPAFSSNFYHFGSPFATEKVPLTGGAFSSMMGWHRSIDGPFEVYETAVDDVGYR